MALLFVTLPGGFLPDEDQGFLFTQVTMPTGSTAEQTEAVMAKVRKHYLVDEKANVAGLFTAAGFGFVGIGQNAGLGFATLKDWSERPGKAAASRRWSSACSSSWRRSVIGRPGDRLRAAGRVRTRQRHRVRFRAEDVGNVGHEQAGGRAQPAAGHGAAGQGAGAGAPQRPGRRAAAQAQSTRPGPARSGLSQADINTTVSTAFGSAFVNQFIDRGRVKKVYRPGRRALPHQPRRPEQPLRPRRVRDDGAGLGLRHQRMDLRPDAAGALQRRAALEIQGSPAPGESTGAAMARMEALAKQLPPGIGYEWTGLSYEEKASGGRRRRSMRCRC
jgi:multidrug efflux pump subunit AcrB